MHPIALTGKGILSALLVSSCLLAGWLVYDRDARENVELSDSDEDASLRAQIGNMIVGYAAEQFKHQRESELLHSNLSEQELIARLLDESSPLATRKLDAWRLAVLGGDNAKLALLSVLQNGSDAMRAIVAEMLGHGRWPDVPDILGRLLSEENTLVARGAVSGLALLGNKKALAILRDTLLNGAGAEALLSFIAYRLGDIQTPEALDALKTAFARPSMPEETLRNVVASLGKYPFQHTSAIFRQIVADSQLSSEFKAEATESLIRAGKGALAFLRETAADHADPRVRASAAWTAGAHPNTGRLSQPLTELLSVEADDEVRRRLYEAMMRQADIPAAALLDRALSETTAATRVAAANMLAVSLQQPNTGAEVQNRYDLQIVPQLLATALSDESLNLRYRAVFALARAGTETALTALKTIQQQGEPQIAGLAGRNIAHPTH